MKKIGKYIFLGAIGVCGIIILPILLDCFVFKNNIPSGVSNDAWAGFLGSYTGAIIGAITTLLVVKLEINNDKRSRKDEEINKLRPYLYLEIKGKVISRNITKVNCVLYNVGLQAACDVCLYNNQDNLNESNIVWNEHMLIPQNSTKQIEFKLDLTESECYKFVFYDVKSNRYEQEIKAVCTYSKDDKVIKAFLVLEPRLSTKNN